MGLGIYADGPDGIYAGYQEQLYELRDELAEKDRIIAALRAELIDHMDDPPDGDDAKFYKAVDEYIDRVIEQARSGK
jgi:hypothetical protein